VGRGRALELLLTGRVINADEAFQYGLVEYVYPDRAMLEKAVELASQIASYSGPVTAATKLSVNRGLRDGWQTGLALESDLRVKTGRGPDASEGRLAFLEKREPKFNREK
jgi:enoyl-CoA hydratase/carnithine racemase